MNTPQALEGTWEQVKQHDQELAGKRVRLTVVQTPQPSAIRSQASSSQPARGMLSHLSEGSEEFALRKRQEIERE